ncbi:MAG: hypothetical protein IKG01_12655, partial [Lachnospiraceae bacterium]|nr:hypothetical protein [Lachnospiraceae bacterium]
FPDRKYCRGICRKEMKRMRGRCLPPERPAQYIRAANGMLKTTRLPGQGWKFALRNTAGLLLKQYKNM